MDRDKAIQTLMRKIKYDAQIPPEFQGFIRGSLYFMYAIGFDEGRKYIRSRISYGRKKRPVCRLDLQKRLIETYPTVKMAAKKAHHRSENIYKAIKTKTPFKQYYWMMKSEFLKQ